MISQAGDSKETEALTGLIDLARTGLPTAEPARMSSGLDSIVSRLASRRRWRRRLLRSSLMLATGTACALLVWGAATLVGTHLQTSKSVPLAYTVEGGSVIEGGYLRETGSTGVKLSFTEGSTFTLQSGARGRLRTVDSSGARIAIEQGSAWFRITPHKNARWLVDVGPFLVTVKGTVFSLRWDPTSERFELRLQRGRVAVSGPVSGGEIALAAGQRLVVTLPKAETLITEDKPDEPWIEPVRPAAETAPRIPSSMPKAAADEPSGRLLPSPRPESAKSEGGHRWSEAIAAGQWDLVLAEAKRAGLKATVDKASIDDLSALADAARYRRRNALARTILLAERRRFPESARALDAAFLLGRLEEESDKGTAKALWWYDEYLARSPNGTYASEALGRKMMVTNSREGASRARPIADEYLRRFPHGTYVGAAQALRRGP